MDGPSFKYRAFISYSKKDKTKADRLHRALEAYRAPKGIQAELAGRRKLGLIFLDDKELAGAAALRATLEGALEESESLIVLCTPNAASSKWVDAEIRAFRHRRDPNRVFAVIAAGEANATLSDDPESGRYECFPPALRGLTPNGEPDPDAYPEPLAPDWRKDGFARIQARLAAAMLGVDFDHLWKRDRRRARSRALRMAAGVAAAAVILSAVFLWIDLVNWKRSFASRTVEAVAQARELAQMAKSANAEDEEAEVLTVDALHARRRAARSAIAALGTRGMLARPDEGEVYRAIWDSGLASRRLWELCGQRFLNDVRFSVDGRWLVASTLSGGSCAVRVMEDLSVEDSNHSFDRSAVFDTGSGLAAVTRNDGTIRIVSLDAGSGQEVHLGHEGTNLIPIAFSRDGQRLFASDEDGAVSVWNAFDGSAIGRSPAFGEGFRATPSIDGKRMLLVSWHQLAVWDISSNSVRTQAVQIGIFAAAFDAGSDRVITAEEDWVVRTRDAVELSILKETRLNGANTLMLAAAFDAGVLRIVTVEQDGGAVRIWQISDGERLAEVWSPEQWFDNADISPDGRTLVTITRNSEVRLWPLGSEGRALSPAELRAHLCKRLMLRHRTLDVDDGWRLAWRLVPADPCEWRGAGDIDFWGRISIGWARLTRGVGAAGPPTTETEIIMPGAHRKDF